VCADSSPSEIFPVVESGFINVKLVAVLACKLVSSVACKVQPGLFTVVADDQASDPPCLLPSRTSRRSSLSAIFLRLKLYYLFTL
jgi:hypothetical protein